jgi:hypothetical protein
MWAACELLASRPLTVSLTVKLLPESVSCAVPLTDSPALAFGAASSGSCSDSDDVGETLVGAISLQTIGKNWSLGERAGPLWTFTYQPVGGTFGTLLIVVVDVPTPCASATTFCKGYTTGP